MEDNSWLEKALTEFEVGSPLHQMLVAESLGRSGDKRAVPVLLNALDQDDLHLQQVIIEALGILGDLRAREPLLRFLNSSNRSLAIWSANALAQLGDKNVGTLLLTVLRKEQPHIYPLVEPEDQYVAFDEVLKMSLSDSEKDVRNSAVLAFKHWPVQQAIVPLVLRVLAPDEERFIKLNAINVLASIGNASIAEMLRSGLAQDSAEVREAVVYGLASLGNTRDCATLLQMLHMDPDPQVRAAVVYALGKLGDDTFMDELIFALNDPDEAVKRQAINILETFKDSRIVELLMKTFTTASSVTRLIIVIALGKNRVGGGVQDFLINALRDPDDNVRWAVITALSTIGDRRALPYLRIIQQTGTSSLDSTFNTIRDLAAHAMLKIEERI